MRVLRALALFLAILPLIALLNYHFYSSRVEFAGPAAIKPSGPKGVSYLAFHVPAKALAEIDCSGGNGRILVVDRFDGKEIFNGTTRGSLSQEFVVPGEGTYWVVYNGKGDTTCFVRFKRKDPTTNIQNAFYLTGIAGALLLLVELWRERK
ncbi:hypothetical protein [Thermococcus sp. Bubb.Bath]|uniref:hypothetical protein n=2 Tax=unclassified Thermococcus TaxID=2627626 RepID=UPI00143B2A50|nr:hypothetical protein [Thermococcus sp. Bubb.Bath]NJF24953.1 hypothetical protein [Thermococcus sp. Bubb.Bath]